MAGTTATVLYNGINITSSTLFESATFTSVAKGEPGSFEFRVKDTGVTFETGNEVTFSLGGTKVFGGYVTQIGRTFAFPDKIEKIWVLRGVDYNVLFDKRVLRNTSEYLKHLPISSDPKSMDGDVIRFAIENYTDLADFSVTTIDNVDYYNNDGVSKIAYPQQGLVVRELFEGPAFKTGSVYYISADKKIHYHALETVTSTWGFSDVPGGSMMRMHDASIVEDGSYLVNDALVWGGSQFAGDGGTAFSRVQSPSSQSIHGRWQLAETHFNEEGYGLAAGCNARAKSIINGPGGVGVGMSNQIEMKGLKNSQWQMSFSWWLHDVPSIPVPGSIFTIALTSFGITKELPLRSLTMTFPELDEQGRAYVLMRGEFAINVNDPFSLWSYLRRNTKRVLTTVTASVDDTSLTTVYGAYGSFHTKIESLGNRVYKLPFGYIPATLMVYTGGLALTPNTGFTETDNIAGTFTLASAPTGVLYATCRTLHA